MNPTAPSLILILSLLGCGDVEPEPPSAPDVIVGEVDLAHAQDAGRDSARCPETPWSYPLDAGHGCTRWQDPDVELSCVVCP
jgi:hypothetical protein